MENLLKKVIELWKTEHDKEYPDFYGNEISSDELLEAIKEVETDEETKKVIETIFMEDAPILHRTLLSMTTANYWSYTYPERPPDNLKKSQCALRLLLNIIQRSPDFGSKIPSECVEIIETLLATGEFQSEILLLLVKTADGSWLEFQKSPRYSYLVERVVSRRAVRDDEPLVLAYFSTLFEKDRSFLADFYAEILTPSTFCDLLDILKTIQERQESRIHPNNLLFIINLLEFITSDFEAFLKTIKPELADEIPCFFKHRVYRKRRESTVEMLSLLLQIVSEMCKKMEMWSHLSKKATAINAVLDVLDAILHAEAEFADFRKTQPWPEVPDEPEFANLRKKIEEEQKYEKMKKKPKQPPLSATLSRDPRIEASATLKQLSEVFLENYKKFDKNCHKNGELKMHCLNAFANLCILSASNRLATVQNGRMGLLSVLQCTTRRPACFMENYALVRSLGIFSFRQLTDECQENKEVILRLGEPEQPIIDRKLLVEAFGIDDEDLKQNGRS